MSCSICGHEPRSFTMFRGSRYWFYRGSERMCPTCANWLFNEFGVECEELT